MVLFFYVFLLIFIYLFLLIFFLQLGIVRFFFYSSGDIFINPERNVYFHSNKQN